MKKFFVLAVAMLMAGSVFAATETTTYVAKATFAGVADFSFVLKNVSGTGTPTQIEWTKTDAFNMSEDVAWVMADQYAEVTANITKANANVYMYTNNKVDSGITGLKASHWKDDQQVQHDSFGGLVRTAGQGTPEGGDYRGYVPVMFSYNTTADSTITCNGEQVIIKDGTGDDAPVTRADRFLADIDNDGYVEKDNTIASLNGPTFGVDATTGAWPGACTDNKAYMYFFGGFKQVIGGDTYQTKIYVKEVIE